VASDAEARAAMAAGMAQFRERQDFYMAHPEGVTVPADDPSWHSPGPSAFPRGLGYDLPPDPVPSFSGARPGLVPQPVTPPPVTAGPAPSLTGASHGGWAPSGGTVAQGENGSVIYVDAGRPRRTLLGRLLGRSQG
jgi:hypothetical protein